MGLFFRRRRRRRGGSGLLFILLIVGGLMFTPAGAWISERLPTLGQKCADTATSSGSSAGLSVCERMVTGLANGLATLSQQGDALKARVGIGTGGIRLSDTSMAAPEIGGGGWGERIGNALRQKLGNADFTLPFESPNMSRYMNFNLVQSMQNERSGFAMSDLKPSGQMSMSLTQGAIGQRLLQGVQGFPKSIDEGRDMLERSAANGKYGVMSQLQLGSYYANGSYGLEMNAVKAREYLEQAKQSIAELQASDTPEAKQMLSMLPGGAQGTTGNINAQLSALK